MSESTARHSSSLSIAKRVLTLFLPIALLIGAGAFFICQTERDSMHAEHDSGEHENLNTRVSVIRPSLQTAYRDLRYLYSRRINRQVLDHPDKDNLASLAADWTEFSNAKKTYDQIRWIDETGMERVRVDYKNGGARTIPASDLQNKSNRYYFPETIGLKEGEIYVSPLDLNIEGEQIETPYKPMIRFGVPVFDSQGNKRGIYVINYLANGLLDRFADHRSPQRGTAWLVNQDGYWLKGSTREEEFGFMFGRNELTMAVRHPEAWRRISSAESGQFADEEGLWTFSTVHPLQEMEGAGAGQPVGAAYSWKAVSLFPAAQYNADLVPFYFKIATASLAILALFFIALWRLVKSQTAERDARLNQEQIIQQRTHNLQEANERLSIERLQLRSLIQTVPDLIWLKDPNGVFLLCNHNFERLFATKEKDIVGKTDYDFLPKELAEFFQANDRAAIEADKALVNEEWVTFAEDGRRALLETTKIAVRTASGNLIGVLGIGHDITRRKEAQERERQLKNIYRALSATNDAIIHQLDATALFGLVCQIAVDYGEMVLGWIGIADPSSQSIVTAANYGKAGDFIETIFISTMPDRPEGQGPIGIAYRENRHIVVNDLEINGRAAHRREKARQYGIKSVAAFPIRRGGEPYAVFAVHSDAVDAFSDKIVTLFEGMARNISFALDNIDREAARRQAEAAVKESEARLSRIIEEAPFPMMVHAEDGEILQNNRVLYEITGYAPSEIGTMPAWFEKAFRDRAPEIRANLAHFYEITEPLDNGEFVVHCKDGTRRIWHFISSPIGKLEDGRRAVISMATDITGRKKFEEQLKASEERYRSLFDNMTEGFATGEVIFDEAGRPVDIMLHKINQAFLHQTGLPHAILFQPIRKLLPQLEPVWIERYAQVVATGESIRFTEYNADTRRHYDIYCYRPMPGRFAVLLRDVTQQQQFESALRESQERLRLSEERLRLAQQVARIGSFEWNIQTNVNEWSPELEALYGLPPHGFGKTLEAWIALIHPDDREKTRQLDREALDTGRFEAEWRVIWPDGTVHWLAARARVFKDDAGRPLRMVGINMEITERKKAEEELRLAAMVYQDSSEAMMVTDENNRIIAVNSAFEHITGYKAEEVIGRDPNILRSGRQNKEFYKAMWNSISTTGRWKGEIWNKAKNGREFAELITINTSFNPDGSVFRRVALFSDITQRKKSDELIWQQANFDTLTGLPNRNLFRDHLRQGIRNARRTKLPLALMFLDLDGFKDVNDTLGHDMGDLLLKEAASRLQGCVRDSDTVARLGGDEFTVILPEMHDPGNIDRVARHILHQLSRPIKLGDEIAYVSASIGITLYPQDAVEVEDLIKSADQAMYSAKQEGKNRYHYYTESMQEAAQARMRLVNDLRGALGEGQIEIVYQPIVELATGCIKKAEALMRWQHPTKGFINPSDFISAAEETGLIASLGNWMVREAVHQVARWREQFHPDFQISVNVSPVQFRNGNINFAIWIEQLKSAGLPGDAIVVEITEGLLLEASEKIKDQLLALRDAGIEVSLDDFGTGYSALSYLKKFDIDFLKIDQSFVRNLAPGSTDLALCEAIIEMAHKLNIKVIAEGVESQVQSSLLKNAGCDFVQGYLFSKPLSAKDLDKLLRPGSSVCPESE